MPLSRHTESSWSWECVSPLEDFPGRLTHPAGDLEDGVSALAEEGGGELDPAPSADVRLQVQFLMATEYLLPQ